MITVPKTWEQWFKALIGSVVGTVANCILAEMGLSAASAVGVNVKPLDLRQLGSIALSGMIVGACLYLAKSPVPSDQGPSNPTKE